VSEIEHEGKKGYGPTTTILATEPFSRGTMVPPNWHFQTSEATEALSERHNFVAFLRASCTSDSDYESAVIVFLELVANVIRHAAGPIQIRVASDGRGSMMLEVIDAGDPFVFAPSLPPSTSENGRGLYIVSQLCTYVNVTRFESGNVVRARLPVVPSSPP
jgi:anti-sigma regulatory factor (Ser/Thr protein kinase)